jgi:branched-chain amino acid transport system substrate-binding protein
VLTNAAEANLTIGDPIRVVEDNGQTYALYRVAGRFKASFEFQDFPFDRQSLDISLQNQGLPSSKLVYAVDPEFLALPQDNRLMSGSNAAVSINAIPSWETTDLQMFQESVGSTALMGDPEAHVGSGGIEYSLLTAEVTIHRDLVAFLVKNLLPLALLAAITYVSLFFPHSQTGERVAFAVSAILTAAVLLSTVTAVLPQVGYTVAIEWGFYAFIFLSAICIIIGLAGDWLYEERRLSELRKLDRFSHVFYPLFLLAVAAAYAWRYGYR